MAMASKLLIVCAVLIAGVGYMLYTPVNPRLAEPWKFRITGAMFGCAFMMASIGEKLGFGSQLNISRGLVDRVVRFTSPTVDPQLVQREDTTFNGVPVRIYRPTRARGASALPGLVFYHGGGWVLGSINSHDLLIAHYAVEASIIIVSVEYRMAPEHPFPTPLEDCKKATEYFINNAARFDVDPKRVAVGGDSAGGNLASAVSLVLRDEKFQPMPKAQLLIYPVLQMIDLNLPSYFEARRYNDNDLMAMLIGMYVGIEPKHYDAIAKNRHIAPEIRKKYGGFLKMDALPKGFIPADYKPTDPQNWDETVTREMGEIFAHPLVSPLLAENLKSLPEAFIFTIGADGIRNDGPMFGHRLKEAGVKVTWFDLPNTFHGCITITNGLLGTDSGRQANQAIVKFLKETL